MRRLLGLAGPAGAGKDTAANILKELYGYESLAFAGVLKGMLNVAGVLEPRREDKEAVNPAWGFSYRHAAQTLGTEWGRALHPDFWVQATQRQLETMQGHVVITDVRFENEARMIRRSGGVVVHITGRRTALSEATAAHASEAGLAHLIWDENLRNDGTLPQLTANIGDLLQRIYHGG